MTRTPLLFLPLLAAVLSTLPAVQAQPAPSALESFELNGQEVVAGELLVRVRQGAEGAAEALHADHGGRVLHRFRALPGWQRVQVSGDLVAALKAYRSDPSIEAAEPNAVIRLEAPLPGAAAKLIPDDPEFPNQWALQNTGQSGGTPDADVNGPEAWDLSTGTDRVLLVIDTGLDLAHPDLQPNLFVNPGEIAGNGVDDDGNGYVDDVHGVNTITGSGNPQDDQGHGTAVASVAAAAGNNAMGISGLAPQARLLGCKFLSASGSGNLADAIECFDYALDLKTRASQPVDLLATVNGWGGGGFSQALLDVLQALGQAGVITVVGSGNVGLDLDTGTNFPASYDFPLRLVAAATDRNDVHASYSSFGARSVEVSAPGTDVLTLALGGGATVFSGTEYAAAHAAGLLALLKAQDPMRTPQDILRLTIAGGTPVPGLASRNVGGRRLRAADVAGAGSLSCAGQTVLRRTLPHSDTVNVVLGDAVRVEVLKLDCDAAVAAPVVTGASLSLRDDGLGGDRAAGDGRYTGLYYPSAVGTTVLNFDGGQTLSVNGVSGYQRSDIPHAWRAIAGTNLGQADDTVTTITLPFPIPFANGPGQSSLRVSMNGAVSFESNPSFTNQGLPVPTYATLIAPFWDDLYPGPTSADNVFWAVTGTAPSRELVIEWRNVHHRLTRTGSDTLRFQLVFFEGSPDFEFHYADVNVGNAAFDGGASATVGVQVSSTVATQYGFNQAVLTAPSAQRWSLASPPVLNSVQAAPASSQEGEAVSFTIDFTDASGSGPWQLQLDSDLDGSFDDGQAPVAASPATVDLPVFDSGSPLPVRVRVVGSGNGIPYALDLDVGNVVPHSLSVAAAPLPEGQPGTAEIDFADPGRDAPWQVQLDLDYDGVSFDVDVAEARATTGPASLPLGYAADGTYTVALRVVDADGGASEIVTATVEVSDVAPVLDALSGPSALSEGDTLQVDGSFADGGDAASPYLVEWDTDYDGVSFQPELSDPAPADGAFSRQWLLEDSGLRTIAVRVSDADGSVSALQTLTVDVAEVDPVLASASVDAAGTLEPVSVQFLVAAGSGAANPSADPVSHVSYDFDGDGVDDLSTTSPAISWTFLDNPAGGSVYPVRVRVWDEDSFVETTLPVTVENVPPVALAPADASVDEGARLQLTLSASDASPLDPPHWTLVSGPTGMSVHPLGLLDFSPDAAQAGPAPGIEHLVELEVSDGDGGSDTVNFTVRALNVPPVLLPPEDEVLILGDVYSLVPVVDDPGGAAALSWQLDQGPDGLNLSPGGILTWLPRAWQADAPPGIEHAVQVTVTDDDGASDSASWTLTVVRLDDPVFASGFESGDVRR